MVGFLTSEEILELKSNHRKEKERRVADRIKAVLLSNKGWSYKQIAEALFLDEDTISKHVHEYQKERKLHIVTGGSESKLSSAQAVWLYHRFNNSYRDIEEQLAYRGIIVSYEAIRSWCIKFANHFKDIIKKRERKPTDKRHLDEMTVTINGDKFIL